MPITQLQHLSIMAEHNFDEACEWAENNIPPVKEHLETWGANCGASKSVYRGHLVRMLIDIEEQRHE